jgi:hypothetical protein
MKLDNRKDRTMTYKNRIQSMIWEYKRRREVLRSQFGGIPTRNRDYQKRVRGLTHKIEMWCKTLRRIEQRENRIWQMASMVCNFFGLKTLWHSTSPRMTEKMLLARRVFCKYAIENGGAGVDGRLLAEFLNCHIDTPARIRRRFTKSFATCDDNREVWHRFKLFSKDYNVLYAPHLKTA